MADLDEHRPLDAWNTCVGGGLTWSDVERVEFSDDRTREALRSICAMNLKKYPGSHTSNSVEVAAVLAADKEFLARRFRIYGADLAICCGTGKLVHALGFVKSEPQWKQTRDRKSTRLNSSH